MIITTKNSTYKVEEISAGRFRIEKIAEVRPGRFEVGYTEEAEAVSVKVGDRAYLGPLHTSVVLAIAP